MDTTYRRSTQTIRSLFVLNILLIALSAIVVYFRARLDAPLADGFHEGEYLSSRLYFQGAGLHPVMIHGLMDVWPAKLAIGLFGLERAAAGTRFINQTFGLAAALIVMATAAGLVRGRVAKIVCMTVTAAVLAISQKFSGWTIGIQQGAPAVRDLAPVLSMLFLCYATYGSEKFHDGMTFVAGLITGLGLFWTYNRGLASVVSVAVYAASLMIFSRSLRPAAGVAGGLIGGLCINYVIGPDSFRDNVASIAYWRGHEYIWHHVALAPQSLIIAALSGSAVVLAAVTIARSHARRRRGAVFVRAVSLSCSFAALTVVVFASSLNRFDFVHTTMIVPYALLTTISALSLMPQSERLGAFAARNSLYIAIFTVVALSCLVAAQAYKARLEFKAQWRMLTHGLPFDREIASSAYVQIADMLRQSSQDCTYVFDNDSVFYHLANLRPCSAFMIPIYVGEDAESSVLEELRKASPETIILNSSFWSQAIDNVDQRKRTPRLYAWAEDNYDPFLTLEGVVVAHRKGAK